jgi:hypothetical protein
MYYLHSRNVQMRPKPDWTDPNVRPADPLPRGKAKRKRTPQEREAAMIRRRLKQLGD